MLQVWWNRRAERNVLPESDCRRPMAVSYANSDSTTTSVPCGPNRIRFCACPVQNVLWKFDCNAAVRVGLSHKAVSPAQFKLSSETQADMI